MEINFYSVFDTKLKRFNYPYLARNDEEAGVILLRSGIPKVLYNDSRLFKVGIFKDEVFDVDKAEGSDLPLSECFSEVKLPPYPVVGGND